MSETTFQPSPRFFIFVCKDDKKGNELVGRKMSYHLELNIFSISLSLLNQSEAVALKP